MKVITNSSGSFEINDGVLCSFEPKKDFFHFDIFVDIPEEVTLIPKGVFNGLEIRSLKIPASVAEIGEYAFAETKINCIDFESGFNWIKADKTSFWLAYIRDIKFSETNKSSCVFDKALEYAIGHEAFQNKIFVNDLLENAEMISNESGVFFIDSMGMLIAYKLFFEVKEKRVLRNLVIPEGVTVIRKNDFYGITVLEELKFPSTLKLIGTGSGCAFAKGEYNEVAVPENVLLGHFVFGSSKIKKLVINNNFKANLRQFKDCKIETLVQRVSEEGKHINLDARIETII